MPRRSPSFSRLELKRALRSLREIGTPAKAVEFSPNGKFTTIIGEPDAIGNSNNPWDEAIANATNEERPA